MGGVFMRDDAGWLWEIPELDAIKCPNCSHTIPVPEEMTLGQLRFLLNEHSATHGVPPVGIVAAVPKNLDSFYDVIVDGALDQAVGQTVPVVGMDGTVVGEATLVKDGANYRMEGRINPGSAGLFSSDDAVSIGPFDVEP